MNADQRTILLLAAEALRKQEHRMAEWPKETTAILALADALDRIAGAGDITRHEALAISEATLLRAEEERRKPDATGEVGFEGRWEQPAPVAPCKHRAAKTTLLYGGPNTITCRDCGASWIESEQKGAKPWTPRPWEEGTDP